MAQQPTSLARRASEEDKKRRLAEAQEDAIASQNVAEDGKVWVRLVRPHYDRDGVFHPEGLAQVYADEIPSSAKVLTKEEMVSPPDPDDSHILTTMKIAEDQDRAKEAVEAHAKSQAAIAETAAPPKKV